jgi:hypothetical protein
MDAEKNSESALVGEIFYLSDCSCVTLSMRRRKSVDFRRIYSSAFMNCVFRGHDIQRREVLLSELVATSYRATTAKIAGDATPVNHVKPAGMAIVSGTTTQFHKGRSNYR